MRPIETAGKASQAATLAAISDFAEVFRGTDGDTAFATVEVHGHRETWPVRSKGFKRWLTGQFFELERKPPGAQALADALNVVEARAQFRAAMQPVHIRVAPDADGSIVIDLADDEWRTVQITADGWRLRTAAPVKFRRARGMLSLPPPVRGGSLEELRSFLNVRDDAHWTLVAAWLVAAVRPVGPYPVLVLGGEQGAAKSTMARVLRRLVDPNSAELRAEPTEVRDVMIAATNGWVINLDNISHIPAWLSDCLCRLATGGGFATRELYSDGDETIFDAQRPVILNGIEEVVTRGDLLDRAILLTLPAITGTARRAEREFWEAFGLAQPRILGGLFDAVSIALRRMPTVTLPRLPRMADFALWVTAAAPALGLADEDFIATYEAACGEINEVALEATVVAAPLRELAAKGEWCGTATELLKALGDTMPEEQRRAKEWPKTGRALSGAIRRIGPNLRAVGVEVVFDREPSAGRRRVVTIRTSTGSPVHTVRTVRASTDSSDGLAQSGRKGRTVGAAAKCAPALTSDGSDDSDSENATNSSRGEDAEWTG
jgi:hypothetical protein